MVFASSCENLPNTMLEAMAFGVPIVSANRPPMPDLAQDACLYFDPQDAASIAGSIRQALLDWPATRVRMQAGLALAQAYSWDHCADQTFAFLRSCHAARNDSPCPEET
jgi:glycosyltransferase involved in cell wall biosynthesis